MFSYLFGVCPSLLYGPYTSEIKSINNGSSSAALYQGKQQNPQFVIFCKLTFELSKCMVNYVLDFLLHSRRTVLRKIYEKILKKYICFFCEKFNYILVESAVSYVFSYKQMFNIILNMYSLCRDHNMFAQPS